MKVLFLLHEVAFAGAGKAAFLLITALKKMGIECVVVLPKRGALGDLMEKNGIKCIYIRFFYIMIPPFLRNPFKDKLLFFPKLPIYLYCNLYAVFKIASIAKKNSIDIVHSNVGPLHIGYYVANIIHRPHVWHIREYQKHYGIRMFLSEKAYFKRLAEKNNHSIAITKAVFDYHHLQEHKDCVIYDGVFWKSEVIDFQIKETLSYLLYLGGFVEQKGLEDLLMAYIQSDLNKTGLLKLYIAGQIPQNTFSNRMQTIIDANKENIVVLGFLSESEIQEMIRNAKALVVPSLSEGFGFVSVEAMLAKCLVIGRNKAGLKEQFDNGLEYRDEEIAIRFEDRQELLAIFNSLEAYSIERVKMVNAAYLTVLNLYSVEKHAEEVLKFYNKILANYV